MEALTRSVILRLLLQVVPLDQGDRIPPPTPEPSPVPERPVRAVSRRVYPRMPSDISLTTITEEPTQVSSHEIVVCPEVVVETNYGPGGATCIYNSSSRNVSGPVSLWYVLVLHSDVHRK